MILAGINFGYLNPTVITVIEFSDKKSRVIDEFYQAGLTITDVITECKKLIEKNGIELFFADPSQPAYINKMNREAVQTVNAKTPKYLSDGMNIILRKIKNEELIIDKCCHQLVAEFLIYKDVGRIERGIDSLIYVFHTLNDIPRESVDVAIFE